MSVAPGLPQKKTVRDIDVAGKKVLLRVDFNVPLDRKTGDISDDTRLRASLITIRYLLEHNARVILCSHLGRPDGKVVEALRLAPVAAHLARLLGKPVKTAGDCVGPEVESMISQLQAGQLLMLENLRFHKEEEKNDPAFAQALARLAEVYVNDAFGTTHRAHASTAGVASYLPAVAGFLLEKEISVMGQALYAPVRPFAAIIGGAKVSDKVVVLENIVSKVDCLLIGGGMACTFLKAQGYEMGRSLVEEDKLGAAVVIIKKAQQSGVKLLLPVDAVIAQEIEPGAATRVVAVDQVPPDWRIGDIGPKTIELFSQELTRCATIIWNGPMGVFEVPEFAQGTRSLVTLLAELKATTIVGGGSSAEAVAEMGMEDKISHVSTGGGASLEFMEGKVLPGVAALLDK